MLYPSQIVPIVVKKLKQSSEFADTVIFTEYDTNIDEKPNAEVFIAVGLDSYYISEDLDEFGQPTDTREYTAEVKISYYGKYRNGAAKCYFLIDKTIRTMFEQFTAPDAVKGLKCSSAAYRRDVDSIVVDLTFEIKGIYYA